MFFLLGAQLLYIPTSISMNVFPTILYQHPGIKMTHISSDEDLIPIITLRRKKSKFMGTNKAQKKKEKSIHNKQVMMNKLYFKHSRARNANNHPQKKLALQKRKDIDIKEKIEIKTMLFNIVVYQLVL
ncbi:hypothetical protein PIB30_026097 [Stylosanthes scabra]|uniref:Uncharacterized protein n=1 Tax=Stylosanthes scabra TaxID=79078 RepID=A0ABU6SA05_9FABA|nr:hypothetical protein [Stylosanthes scabra]